jgi:Mrp family chromosome partitioning ATPase
VVAADTSATSVEKVVSTLQHSGGAGRGIAVVGARRNVGTTRAAIALARGLAAQGRTVLVDLALDSPNLNAIASEPNTPGLSDLVQGAASFGHVITRDRHSPVHLVTVGEAHADRDSILTSPRLAIVIEALSRSYDHVVLDGGALPAVAPERLVKLAARAVLVSDSADDPATETARQRLLSAGFPDVGVLAPVPDGPQFNSGSGRAAA